MSIPAYDDSYARPWLPAPSLRQPVQCGRCGRVYDLGRVEVAQRFTDCSVWKAPCCDAVVDDRGLYFPMGTALRDVVEVEWDGWAWVPKRARTVGSVVADLAQ